MIYIYVYTHSIKISYMANFVPRSSGDLNNVLIDPAEDWPQVRWSRDHFPSRELIFDRFPRPNFEIAARGRPTTSFQLLTSKFRWLKRRFNRSGGRLVKGSGDLGIISRPANYFLIDFQDPTSKLPHAAGQPRIQILKNQFKNWCEPINLHSFLCRIRICSPSRPKTDPWPDFDDLFVRFFFLY